MNVPLIENLDDPTQFESLTPKEQEVLLRWIGETFLPSKTVGKYSSYGLKHVFEEAGFYVTNGAFKGAMRKAGFAPVQEAEQNWRFRYRAAKPCKGKLWAGSLQTPRACSRPADVVSGLCSYHARRGVDTVPVQPPATVERWIKSRGYDKYPGSGGRG